MKNVERDFDELLFPEVLDSLERNFGFFNPSEIVGIASFQNYGQFEILFEPKLFFTLSPVTHLGKFLSQIVVNKSFLFVLD